MGLGDMWVRSSPNSLKRLPGESYGADVMDSTAAFVRDELSFFVPARFPGPVAWAIGLIGLVLIAAAVLYVGKRSADPRAYPVNEVEVSGTLDYTDRDALRERVVKHAKVGFYSLDLEAIRVDIKRMPWIAEAYIRRISPDRLSIEVTEHEPAARWNKDSLISKRFELFQPPQLQPDSVRRAEWIAHFSRFPQLRGSKGRHEEVLAAFRSYEAELTGFDVEIEALLEDARHSRTLLLDNQVSVKLGSTHQSTRIGRFVDVFNLLVPEFKGESVKFDMRYRNGFAVTRPGSPRAFSSIEAAARSTRGIEEEDGGVRDEVAEGEAE